MFFLAAWLWPEEVVAIRKNELRLANAVVNFTGNAVDDQLEHGLLCECIYGLLSKPPDEESTSTKEEERL